MSRIFGLFLVLEYIANLFLNERSIFTIEFIGIFITFGLF